MNLVMEFNREELNSLQFPIIVENWEKVKESGSKRRKWLAEFSEEERKTLGEYYKRFHEWYLKKGTPEFYIFRKAETLDLVKRAVHFFATV